MLVDQAGELIAFVLGLAVIASVWWINQRLLADLGSLEPGLRSGT